MAKRCYLCDVQRPEADTEVTRHVVTSLTAGGTIAGVHRYVRMCRVGFGCKAPCTCDAATLGFHRSECPSGQLVT